MTTQLRQEASPGAARTLAGLTWQAHSPSLYGFHGAWIGYDGVSWRVGALGDWADRQFPTREAAAQVVLQAFTERKEDLG